VGGGGVGGKWEQIVWWQQKWNGNVVNKWNTCVGGQINKTMVRRNSRGPNPPVGMHNGGGTVA